MNTSVDSVCDACEQCFQAGQSPEIGDFLNRVDEESRDELLRELIQIELWWRREETLPPTEEQFLERFQNDRNVIREAFRLYAESVPADAAAEATQLQSYAAYRESTLIQADSPGEARKQPTTSSGRFGRYELLKELGRGGMGAVYLAHDETLKRKVALKVPTFRENVREEMLTRFYREARAAAALRDPGICPVHDVGEIDGQAFIAMAFIEGRPLRDYTKSKKPQEAKKTVRVIRKLAQAMSEAHEAGIVHRDLKPANIMMEKGRRPVIMDFGLAYSTTEMESRLTGTGAILGTPTYMSPEQAMGDTENIGPATDIYSLGVICYEMLAGCVPFEGNVTAVLTKIATQEPKPLSEYGLSIDATLEAIVARMMAKTSSDRYASMNEVVAALTAYLRDSTSHDEQPKRGDGEPEAGDLEPQSLELLSLADPDLNQFLKSRQETVAAQEPTQPTVISKAVRTGNNSGPSRTDKKTSSPSLSLIVGGIAVGGLLLGGLYLAMRDSGTPDSTVTQNADQVDSETEQEKDSEDKPEKISGRENSIGIQFVPIEPGTFTMGEGETAHEVTLTQPFAMGQFEVTQSQYERVMGHNPSQFKGAQNPVELVSWEDAVEFCQRLSDLPAERAAGFAYRLPTEAEWEYACRAGTTTTYSFGDDAAELGDYAWYVDNSNKQTHPVGQKKPNPWGLYDMHGNVFEWCSDWYGEYPSGPITDPGGPSTGSARVDRGGCWHYGLGYCPSANRRRETFGERYFFLGFRVVRVRRQANSIGMRFVPIKPGTFIMGEGEDAHEVTLTQPFAMGQFEVAQEQYERVMGKNPSHLKQAPQNPVEMVSWEDAVEFCRRLSELPEEQSAGFTYRLPNEAEWEYACRAGTTTAYSFGDDSAELGDFAWYVDNASKQTHPVGQKKPNPWGLYDMHGNVWEWCSERAGDYPSGEINVQIESPPGTFHVCRGGSWVDPDVRCDSPDRSTSDKAYFFIGFRVVRERLN